MEDSGKEQVTLARIADILISLSEAAANFIKIQFTTLSSIRWIGCNLSMSHVCKYKGYKPYNFLM